MEERDIINRSINEDEIDLIEIVKKLWKNRNFIIKVTLVFAVLGFIVAISTPNVYTASCTMVPQTGQKSAGGSLGGLAAMAGINLGNLNSGEVLSPTIYPKIMTNINFQKELIYSKFHFRGVETPITFFEYFTDKKYRKFSLFELLRKYSIGLPGIINGAIQGEQQNIIKSDSSSLQFLTSKEKDIVKIINTNLSLNVNNKDGYVSLSVNMSEPTLAAELAQRAQTLLQKYITDFKIEKVSSNLRFVEKSFEEAKRNFEKKQDELAKFRDSNKNLSSSLAKTQEEKLTSEYNLLLNIYSELAKQKEQAKIAVTETTPILTVIEPVYIPLEKSSPSRALIIFLYILMGLIVGFGIVIIVPFIEYNFNPNINKFWLIPKIY